MGEGANEQESALHPSTKAQNDLLFLVQEEFNTREFKHASVQIVAAVL